MLVTGTVAEVVDELEVLEVVEVVGEVVVEVVVVGEVVVVVEVVDVVGTVPPLGTDVVGTVDEGVGVIGLNVVVDVVLLVVPVELVEVLVVERYPTVWP